MQRNCLAGICKGIKKWYDGNMETMYQKTNVLPDVGFQIEFVTMKYNSPPHWHQEMEILYILNGSAVIIMEGERYQVRPLDLIVIDSATVHEVVYKLPQTMGICIHISKGYLRRYIANIELMHIACCQEKLRPNQMEAYNQLCAYLKDLTVLYFEQKASYSLNSSAKLLQIMAVLVDQFSQALPETALAQDNNQRSRIEQLFRYVEQHYREHVSLDEAAGELGLNKEYFCRFFKKNTGLSFLQYVNRVRLSHVYQDLLYSEGGIQEILERNGIYNTKLFYQQFKETYQCTPMELKRMSKNNPYL